MWSDADISFIRESQAALMGDTVILSRATGETWDEQAQQTVEEYTTIYEGKARAATLQGEPALTDSGELVTPQTVMLSVPWDTDIRTGDRATINGTQTVWVDSVEQSALPNSVRRASCQVLS